MTTTIFPVILGAGTTVHAAYVLDYRTDKWATMCGRAVPDPTDVIHRVTEVTCKKCADNIDR